VNVSALRQGWAVWAAQLDPYTLAWILWVAAFFAIEIPAIRNRREGDTLTEHLRKWFAVQSGSGPGTGRWWRLRRLALLAALAWLVVHLLRPDWV
jgi:hypothetical protein